MKIAFFTFGILEYWGGFEKFLVELASHYQKKYPKSQITIVTMNSEYVRKLHKFLSFYYMQNLTSTDIFRVSSTQIEKKLGKVKYINASSFKDLKKIFCKNDIILSKNEILEASVFKFIIKYSEIPPVIFSCGTSVIYPITTSITSKIHNFIYGGLVYQYLTKGVVAFQAKNSYDYSFLLSQFKHKSIYKILNLIDIKKFISDKKTVNVVKNYNFSVVWVGRFTEQKGVSDLVKIINYANKRSKKIDWHIIGSDGEVEQIEKLSQTADNVHYHGFVPHESIASLLKQSDILLTTSKWEGCPNNVMEAQAIGLPVCGFDIAGVNDIVVNGKTGFLANDWKSVYRNILKIKRNNIFSKKIIQTHATKIFDVNTVLSQFNTMFKNHVKS